MSEMEEIKRAIFEVALSPEELERLKRIQEAIMEGWKKQEAS
ncbi:unnamed protein product [marine sediment metagenome]|uniref:Uncharacterized protein n=1 Tax=marine sediment metagenome TaxID=412755 RepID=X1HK94_9ZZZZ